jgi:capsule polysaccharide export protein KpsE/RkpR
MLNTFLEFLGVMNSNPGFDINCLPQDKINWILEMEKNCSVIEYPKPIYNKLEVFIIASLVYMVMI